MQHSKNIRGRRVHPAIPPGTALFLTALVLWIVSGCASSGGSGTGGALVDEDTSTPGVPDPGATVEEVLEWSKANLADDELLTVRLTTSHASESLPVIRLETEDVFTLQFDIPGVAGEPYSIRFFPATREWRPSTEPEPVAPPLPDEIVDYRTSMGMDFPYVHYLYQFPNARTNFQRSGNYILQVFDEHTGDVLFERKFLVTDAELDFEIRANSYSLITAEPDELKPEVRVAYPIDPWWSQDDCTVCFIKNGWVDQIVCLENSRIEGQTYVYEIQNLFPATIPVHSADLRSEGGDVLRRDENTIPETVILFSDDHRIASGDYRFASPVPRAGVVESNPSTPYVFVRFSLINAPAASFHPPTLVGSFCDWMVNPRHQMEWDPVNQVYFIDLVLQEAEIFYSYLWEDAEDLPLISKFEGPPEVSYTAFIYTRDARYATDRLLAVQSRSIRGK